MTPVTHNPSNLFPPYRGYVHALEVPAGSRLLFISGLNGFLQDGTTMPDSFEDQAELIWAHIRSILASGRNVSVQSRIAAHVLGRSNARRGQRANAPQTTRGTPCLLNGRVLSALECESGSWRSRRLQLRGMLVVYRTQIGQERRTLVRCSAKQPSAVASQRTIVARQWSQASFSNAKTR